LPLIASNCHVHSVRNRLDRALECLNRKCSPRRPLISPQVRNRFDRASADDPDTLIPTCDYLISDGLCVI